MVKLLSVTAQQPLHTDAQVGPRRLYDQVKMIGHTGKAVQLPRRSFTGASEQIEKEQPICVTVYDRFAAIASAQNMISGTCVLDSEGTSHISSVTSGQACVNKCSDREYSDLTRMAREWREWRLEMEWWDAGVMG